MFAEVERSTTSIAFWPRAAVSRGHTKVSFTKPTSHQKAICRQGKEIASHQSPERPRRMLAYQRLCIVERVRESSHVIRHTCVAHHDRSLLLQASQLRPLQRRALERRSEFCLVQGEDVSRQRCLILPNDIMPAPQTATPKVERSRTYGPTDTRSGRCADTRDGCWSRMW